MGDPTTEGYFKEDKEPNFQEDIVEDYFSSAELELAKRIFDGVHWTGSPPEGKSVQYIRRSDSKRANSNINASKERTINSFMPKMNVIFNSSIPKVNVISTSTLFNLFRSTWS